MTTCGQSVEISDLIKPVKDEMAQVETWLNTNLIDDSASISSLLGMLFKAGGKRIRPLVTLLASKASLRPNSPAHSQMSRLHIILAVLTELIHSASLVHDDVIDQAATRRGKETINSKYSPKLAVLMGDLLFAQASICLARIMNPIVVGIYGQVLGDLCSGEIKQMNQQFSTTVDWDAYIQKSVGKTASLIAAGAHAGAILNGQSDKVVQALKDYGTNLGIVFQIVDDMLDITGDPAITGKPACGDLSNGVITAPFLYVLESGDSASLELSELIQSKAVQSKQGLDRALQLMTFSKGLEKSRALAQSYADKARSSLAILPPSDSKTALSGLIDYILIRNN